MPKRAPTPKSNEARLTRGKWLARFPWTPVVATLLLIASSAFAVKPVRDAATLAEVSEAFLVRPVGYIAMAPISGVLDTLTLLSVRQHVALVAGVLLLFTVSRFVRSWRGATWRGHLTAIGVLLGVIVTTYAAAALLPRPMASLASPDAAILRVDFHSHTLYSRDARGGFSVEQNRAWHRAAGYDVAFITDHATVQGAERAMADNPPAGLDGVVLLQAIEATWTGEHVAILGAQRTYRGILTENLRDVEPRGLELASLVPTREPVVIWNHPRDLNRLPAATEPASAGIRAIEIANGAPDGMDKIRPKRAAIVALAQRHNLALTTGSDNHGWGRVAPNWTLLRPGAWRGLDDDELALRIERVLREGRFDATRVVERVVADPGANSLALAFTAIAVPWRMLTTLSADERIMWLFWIWAAVGATWWLRRRRLP